MKKVLIFTFVLLLAATMLTLTTATAQQYVHTADIEANLEQRYTSGLAFMQSGQQLATLSYPDDNGLTIWNASTLERIRTVDTNFGEAYSVAYRNGWYEAAVGGNSGRLEFWNTLRGTRMATVDPPGSDYFISMEYSPDGKKLATGSDENRIHIWNADHRSGPRRVLRTLLGHTDEVTAVAWSPDGSILASGSDDGTVRLWNPNNGINFATLRGHRSGILDIEFSPDGQILASCSYNSSRLWDVDTESLLHAIRRDRSYAVGFHPNGQILAVNEGRTARLYDPRTGELQTTLSHPRGGLSGIYHPVQFISNGETIAMAYNNVRNSLVIGFYSLLTTDVTRDGVVDLNDLVEVARNYGKTVTDGANRKADVNGDGRVDIADLTAVAKAINPGFAAPTLTQEVTPFPFTAEKVQQWIQDAKKLGVDAEGIATLEQLLQAVLRQVETAPKETALLANYPNPFNPETWIPYQLAKPAEVRVSIHAADGRLVRTLALGQLPAGVYQDKERAAYWDGKNEQGEAVASGVYFYTLKAGEFSATKKMLIRK